MNLLLDTHIFLWLNEQPEKLSANILSHCEVSNNCLFLSHVSPWEIQIKQQLGKLALDEPMQAMIETQQQDNDLQLLPIKLAHFMPCLICHTITAILLTVCLLLKQLLKK